MIAYVIVLIGLLCAATVNAETAITKTEEARTAELLQLSWIDEPEKYPLSKSSGTLRLRPGYLLARDADAGRFYALTQGVESKTIEAVVVHGADGGFVMFDFMDSGYVTVDDWKDVDPSQLLSGIRANTEEANKKRREVGIGALHVLGWAQEPTFDRSAHSVYWAIRLQEGPGVTVNAVALKLGRKGFERLTWVGEERLYNGRTRFLQEAIDDHQYNSGFRYADYSVGDKLAGFGIASLVAVTAGATTKEGKGIIAAILGVIALVLKKAWVAIFLPIVAAWWGIKRMFRRKAAAGLSDHPDR